MYVALLDRSIVYIYGVAEWQKRGKHSEVGWTALFEEQHDTLLADSNRTDRMIYFTVKTGCLNAFSPGVVWSTYNILLIMHVSTKHVHN